MCRTARVLCPQLSRYRDTLAHANAVPGLFRLGAAVASWLGMQDDTTPSPHGVRAHQSLLYARYVLAVWERLAPVDELDDASATGQAPGALRECDTLSQYAQRTGGTDVYQ